MDFEEFKRVHGILLASAGLPSGLYSQLHSKLSGEVFDGGRFCEVETLEEEGQQQRRLVLSEESLTKESQVFLVDHAWSFRLADARKQVIPLSQADSQFLIMIASVRPKKIYIFFLGSLITSSLSGSGDFLSLPHCEPELQFPQNVDLCLLESEILSLSLRH